jgi:hypothetical protein
MKVTIETRIEAIITGLKILPNEIPIDLTAMSSLFALNLLNPSNAAKRADIGRVSPITSGIR